MNLSDVSEVACTFNLIELPQAQLTRYNDVLLSRLIMTLFANKMYINKTKQ